MNLAQWKEKLQNSFSLKNTHLRLSFINNQFFEIIIVIQRAIAPNED